MRNKLSKRYPAYQGGEPYLYLCFADADAKRVKKLIERMYARGTRVWYCVGKARDLNERREREARMKGAALIVAYLSEAAREDLDFKNAALYCQSCGTPILCVDADKGISALSVGFKEDTPHVGGRGCRSAAAQEEALVRCEGFSQELIGEDRIVPPPLIVKTAAALAVVSVLALAAVLLGSRVFGWFAPDIRSYDTVVIEDDALRAAVRSAVGGGAITEENTAGLETLRLKELPEDGEELEKLGALTRVEIPQELAPDALWLIDEGYTVVLYGGEGK